MKTSNYTVQILEPSEGWLTQSQDVEIQDRILSKKVFLAITDSIENWKEITDIEAEEIRIAQEEYAKAQEELAKQETELS